jgi:hypothetical protein
MTSNLWGLLRGLWPVIMLRSTQTSEAIHHRCLSLLSALLLLISICQVQVAHVEGGENNYDFAIECIKA